MGYVARLTACERRLRPTLRPWPIRGQTPGTGQLASPNGRGPEGARRASVETRRHRPIARHPGPTDLRAGREARMGRHSENGHWVPADSRSGRAARTGPRPSVPPRARVGPPPGRAGSEAPGLDRPRPLRSGQGSGQGRRATCVRLGTKRGSGGGGLGHRPRPRRHPAVPHARDSAHEAGWRRIRLPADWTIRSLNDFQGYQQRADGPFQARPGRVSGNGAHTTRIPGQHQSTTTGCGDATTANPVTEASRGDRWCKPWSCRQGRLGNRP